MRAGDVMAGWQTFTGDDLTFDTRDSAPVVPKALVVEDSYEPFAHPRPERSWSETVIYEAHLKGLTMRHPACRRPSAGSTRRWPRPSCSTIWCGSA